jgi:hypothetical protein
MNSGFSPCGGSGGLKAAELVANNRKTFRPGNPHRRRHTSLTSNPPSHARFFSSTNPTDSSAAP